jgi:hypothetical protein
MFDGVVRPLAFAGLVALVIDATPDDLSPQWLWLLLGPAWIIGLVAVGHLGRWPMLFAFPLAYAAVAGIHQAWFYDEKLPPDCDPRACLGPLDSIVYLAVPMVLLVALGAGIRGSRRPPSAGQRSAVLELPERPGRGAASARRD